VYFWFYFIKSIREWRELFSRGEPLQNYSEDSNEILTNQDLEQYILGIGDWHIPDEIKCPENKVCFSLF